MQKIIPDTSVLVSGRLSELALNGKLKVSEILIPEVALDELQAQANRGLAIGFEGLDEIQKLRKLATKKKFKVTHLGRLPTSEEIKLAKKGRLDSLIRDLAGKEKATLYTEDLVQAEVAKSKGIDVIRLKPRLEKFLLKRFFTPTTISVHLKEGVKPKAKRGKPGSFKLESIREKKLKKKELERFIRNAEDLARERDDAEIELRRHGAEVIQLSQYRIAISRPPFSKGVEITAVRPVVKLSLEEYKPSQKLMKRIKERAEGILVTGPPGSGKTVFSQSLAEFYLARGKIVKTMESPRDMQLPKEITQYGPLEGRMSKTAQLLLLVRPDYSIFDEVKRSEDFRVFADMRLAGVGMVGVIHSAHPIDAVQRFIGRIALGMIPHVMDTIIFIKGGEIQKVYSLSMNVKVPSGMEEADLTRPVVEVRDFESKKLEYEIYSYGEENVVVPVKEKTSRLEKLAKSKIREEIKKFDSHPVIEFLSGSSIRLKVKNDSIPKLIGRGGKNIGNIEKKLGLSIDVQPKTPALGKEVPVEISEKGASIVFSFDPSIKGKTVSLYYDNSYLFTATVSKKAEIRLAKKSSIGKKMLAGIAGKRGAKAFLS